MLISNPPLMTALEDLMKEVNYDLKEFLRVLYHTEAYQRAADANEVVMGMPDHFQGPLLRRMTAEQIWDSIVGLALPKADNYRPRLKSQLAGVERVRLIYESLAGKTEDEYVALVNEVSEAILEMRPKQTELRKEYVAARAERNEEKARAKKQKLSVIDRELNATVARIGYTRLKQQSKPEELLVALGMSEMKGAEAMETSAEDENAVSDQPAEA